MELSYGPEYEAFRRETRQFFEKNRHLASGGMLGLGGSIDAKALEWQKRLIEHGYAARTIPKEYGGYGA